MSSAWVPVFLVVLVLAMIPLGLKWLQRRMGTGFAGTPAATRIVSAVAVGPHQRVVTVEVGPENARVWLTLGVTAQTINCLHSLTLPPNVSGAADDFRIPVHAENQSPAVVTQGYRP
ncbi:MAG: flagellar biosynthetic protein FliO [Ilumatobacteraceae bacterium]|jgi:flagellar protein FliO/FliZ|nr:flagellar biosynthetic protein FliO [Ilumatobacteraceae bacterium]